MNLCMSVLCKHKANESVLEEKESCIFVFVDSTITNINIPPQINV